MTSNLTLYFAPDNASLCVKLLLAELGFAYDTVLVDRKNRGQKAPDYLRLNPNGLIPTLVTPDGPIFETGAILLWLADQAPGTVFPAPDAPARGAALAELFWMSNTLHAAARMVFYPTQYIDEGAEALRAKTRDRLSAHLTQFEAKGGPQDMLLKCYLAPILRWLGLYGGDTTWFDLSKWPSLRDFTKTFEMKDTVLGVCLSEGLGPLPFSAPSLPHPPKGSAT